MIISSFLSFLSYHSFLFPWCIVDEQHFLAIIANFIRITESKIVPTCQTKNWIEVAQRMCWNKAKTELFMSMTEGFWSMALSVMTIILRPMSARQDWKRKTHHLEIMRRGVCQRTESKRLDITVSQFKMYHLKCRMIKVLRRHILPLLSFLNRNRLKLFLTDRNKSKEAQNKSRLLWCVTCY